MARTVDIARRREIARDAFEAMRAGGARKTSMSALAKALGMKRPTLYWYFKDLGALFEAIFRMMLEDQLAFVAERVAAQTHPIDALYTYAVAVDDFYAEREDVIVLLFELWAASGGDNTDRAFGLTTEFFEERRAAAVKMIGAGIDAGVVVPCDPAVLMVAVSAFIDGLLVQRVTRKVPIKPLHDFLWERVLEPLKRTPDP